MKIDKEDHAYKLGIYTGLSQASSYLMCHALNSFQKGSRYDNEAGQLRIYAEELAKMAEKERPPTPAFPNDRPHTPKP